MKDTRVEKPKSKAQGFELKQFFWKDKNLLKGSEKKEKKESERVTKEEL